MPDFLKKLVDGFVGMWNKISNKQKIIGGVVLAVAVAGIIAVMTISTSGQGVPLFTNTLAEADFDRITSKLVELNIPFTTKGKSQIFVSSASVKTEQL